MGSERATLHPVYVIAVNFRSQKFFENRNLVNFDPVNPKNRKPNSDAKRLLDVGLRLSTPSFL